MSISLSQLLCESEPRLAFRVALSVRLLRLSYGAGDFPASLDLRLLTWVNGFLSPLFHLPKGVRNTMLVEALTKGLGIRVLWVGRRGVSVVEGLLRQRENRRRGRLGTVHLRSSQSETGASL